MGRESVTIDIRGLGRDRTLRAHVLAEMAAAIARVRLEPATAHVAFTDDNGPKGGPAMRCALTVQLPERPALRVERAAVTRRQAFTDGFAALERRLQRYRQRDRDSRRHPKKYYAAKRITELEMAPPRRAKRGAA